MSTELHTGMSTHAGDDALAKEHLPTLDGWRAIAILAVLMCHGVMTIFLPNGLFPNEHLADFSRRGDVGVKIFFGLSGFLICSRLLREDSRTGSINLRSFYVKRCFRILPLYFLYLTIIALLHFTTGRFNLNRMEWLSCIFFWRDYMPKDWQSIDRWYLGHFWSLSVEEQFYFLWPGLLLFLRRGRARLAAAILSMLIVVWRIVPFNNGIDIHMDTLLWGCVIAITVSNVKEQRLLKQFLNPLVWTTLLVLTSLANFRAWTATWLWIPLALPLLIVGTLLNPNWLVSRALENSVLRWIGKVSYGIYVWQELFLVGSHPRLEIFGILQVFPFNFIALFILASLSYYLFEKPLLNYGQTLAARGSAQPAAAIA